MKQALMQEQLDFFSLVEIPVAKTEDIPEPDENGLIPAENLIPSEWEAWQYYNAEWSLCGGKPYIIDAVLAILPGNRVYAKQWMMYPFMYQCKTESEADKMYHKLKTEIIKRQERNGEKEMTTELDFLPPLADMYLCGENEYSCFEYARKENHFKAAASSKMKRRGAA